MHPASQKIRVIKQDVAINITNKEDRRCETCVYGACIFWNECKSIIFPTIPEDPFLIGHDLCASGDATAHSASTVRFPVVPSESGLSLNKFTSI